MGITSLRAWIVAASLIAICAGSHAAGLGQISVKSALGERLNAEIDLVASKSEVGSLVVRLASPDAFERAGLVYSGLMTSVSVSVEKRADGEPYVQIASTQTVTDPFVDLLIDLSWSAGRISREFTAFLDPPAVIAAREKQAELKAQKDAAVEVRPAPTSTATPAPEPVPEPGAQAPTPDRAKTAEAEAPAPEPDATSEATAKTKMPASEEASSQKSTPVESPVPAQALVETIGGTQPTLLDYKGSALPSRAPSVTGTDDTAYGPVKSGDTLGNIARATKPANVTLEQMLVLLVRSNPDAFSDRNMNRLKTGKILQLPSADQFAGISEQDARNEVKVQARDWKVYKEQMAAAAGQAVAAGEPAEQAAAGKVGSAVEDKASAAKEPPKEVLKLSKNEPGNAANTSAGGDAKAAAARIRALEEEAIARDKAVNEANSRVAILEKQIEKLGALVEMKDKMMADLQKSAATPPVASPETPAAQKPAPQKPLAPTTPPPVTPAAPAVKPAPATVEPGAVPGKMPVVTPTPSAPEQPKPVEPIPATAKAATAPGKAPGLIDQLLGEPAYIGAAIGVLVLIGALVLRTVRRRGTSKSGSGKSNTAKARVEPSEPAAAAPVATSKLGAANEAKQASSDEVDPVAEAEIFLAYGRDAQAEELLKEALQTSPGRHEIHLKLLQIYVNRKDASAFEKVARDLQQATGGKGNIWDQASVLGYQIDPGNSRYAAGKSAAGATTSTLATSSASAENVDFNVGTGQEESMATTTDIDLGASESQFERTQIINVSSEPAPDSTASLGTVPSREADFSLPPVDIEVSDTLKAGTSGLNFDIDLNSLASAPQDADSGASAEPAVDTGLDFDISSLSLGAPDTLRQEPAAAASGIDLSGISLDLGTEPKAVPASVSSGKDDHWYDVQTKFDLAKAYQEMGDKDGAREILKEVLLEGDPEQKAAALTVMSELS